MLFLVAENKSNLHEKCLKTGSLFILKDNLRLYYHGVEKIQKVRRNIIDAFDFDCFPKDCRINITLRKFDI